MPIYEFACRSCGHHFDHLQKMSDADPTVCPTCHAEQLHRMPSAPAFRLAGTGWYETDFKKPGDHQHNLAGDAGASSGASSTHHHHDAKVAAGDGASAPAVGASTTKASVAAGG